MLEIAYAFQIINTNLTKINSALTNSYSGQSVVTRSTQNTSAGEATYMRYGRIVVIRGSFTLASTCTGTYTNYGIFSNIPKVYGNLQCPVWTDGEGTTAWLYGDDGKTELRIAIRGTSMAGKICYFSGVYITSSV